MATSDNDTCCDANACPCRCLCALFVRHGAPQTAAWDVACTSCQRTSCTAAPFPVSAKTGIVLQGHPSSGAGIYVSSTLAASNPAQHWPPLPPATTAALSSPLSTAASSCAARSHTRSRPGSSSASRCCCCRRGCADCPSGPLQQSTARPAASASDSSATRRPSSPDRATARAHSNASSTAAASAAVSAPATASTPAPPPPPPPALGLAPSCAPATAAAGCAALGDAPARRGPTPPPLTTLRKMGSFSIISCPAPSSGTRAKLDSTASPSRAVAACFCRASGSAAGTCDAARLCRAAHSTGVRAPGRGHPIVQICRRTWIRYLSGASAAVLKAGKGNPSQGPLHLGRQVVRNEQLPIPIACCSM
jgi:hypothetical protein